MKRISKLFILIISTLLSSTLIFSEALKDTNGKIIRLNSARSRSQGILSISQNTNFNLNTRLRASISRDNNNTANNTPSTEEQERRVFGQDMNSSDFNDSIEARRFRERLRNVIRQMNKVKKKNLNTNNSVRTPANQTPPLVRNNSNTTNADNSNNAASNNNDDDNETTRNNASYNTPFCKNNNSIKQVMNPIVNLFVKYYTTVGKKYLEKAFKQMEKYYPIIVKKLKKNNLPIELALLPVIESSYNEYARSSSGALGLWQLMEMTAKINGLKINNFVDERLDINKATEAAIKFLKHLKKTFTNWDLVLAAYNGGGNYLMQQMRKYRSDNFWEFSKKDGFSQQTMEYVPKFYAVLHIMLNLKKYNFAPIDLKKKPYFEIVKVKGNIHISKIAKVMDLQSYELKELNPQLLQNKTPHYDNNYELYIPRKFSRVFIARRNLLNPVLTRTVVKYVYKRIIVRRGDTVNRIAKRYRVRSRSIIKLNHLRNPNRIVIGMSLLLPIKIKIIRKQRVANPLMRNPSSPARRRHYHRPRRRRQSPAIRRRRARRRHYARIRAQRRRRAIARARARKRQQRARYRRNRRRLLLMLRNRRKKVLRYRIKRGDTVIKIARKLRIPTKRIIRANRGSTKLIAGKILKIRIARR